MLSEAAVKKLRAKRRRYALADVPGLMLHVHPSGRKSWVFRHHGEGTHSLKIGEYPERSLASARLLARKLRASCNVSDDPAYELRRIRELKLGAGASMREFAWRWVHEVAVKARKDVTPVLRMIRADVEPVLGRRQLRSISTDDIRRVVFAKRDRGHGQAAAALRHLLKRIFDYAVACGEASANPVLALPRKFVAPRRSRTRSLSETELRAFLQKCRTVELGRMGWALELLLLTLARKSELRLARWEHIDFAKALWEVPAEISKTGMPHLVFLAPRAVELLRRLEGAAGRSEYVLPKRDALTEPITASALNKAVARTQWGIAPFAPHDLRRTAATLLNERGYNPDWIERALNHATPGVRGVYNRAKYAEERRRMLAEWAEYLEGLAGGGV